MQDVSHSGQPGPATSECPWQAPAGRLTQRRAKFQGSVVYDWNAIRTRNAGRSLLGVHIEELELLAAEGWQAVLAMPRRPPDIAI